MPSDSCPRCGCKMVPLFTSVVCSADCQKLPADVFIIRRHKMDLGDGWVLWTKNEPPPLGWTHVRTEYFEHASRRHTTPQDRPGVENKTGTVAMFSPEWRGFVLRGEAAGFRVWAELERKSAGMDREGFAYKV